MFKVINKEKGLTVSNGITKRSRIIVPNGNGGLLRPYTVIDAITFPDIEQTHGLTFVLLEHETLGEDDMIIARLPQKGRLCMVIREDRQEWGNSQSEVAYLIHSSQIVCPESYNGLDDLEDLGYNLEEGMVWDEKEINEV